ncbi:M10 family metallopeptidase [Kordiimonas aquimaris]|uniref:M10 family metallopeptidase n=1 Tax=Kordiimonas aquimaris TaxID=707591 RepID=UPI0021D20A84|nr:M10 family metallopeptidase [Kordiimonas aquimaris]
MTDGVSGVESRANSEDVAKTGNDALDSLLSGTRWVSDSGSNITTISFSFPDENSNFSEDPDLGYGTSGNEPHTGLAGLSEYGQGLFLSAIANLQTFTNLAFTQVPDEGDSAGTIRVAFTGITDNDSVAFAYLPGAYQAAGDIWVLSENHTEDDTDFLQTLTHELGHALGLKHPHEAEGGFPQIASGLDGMDYTVMSYNISMRYANATFADLFPQTYMYGDILTLQHMYGVDTVTTAGTDTYTYDLNERYYATVWDYGGNDTIAISGTGKSVKLDLTPGSWSNVGTTIKFFGDGESWDDKDSLFIAPDTIIENATASDGDDTLQGNDASNKLRGNDGADKLYGAAGADVLFSGNGDDIAMGGSGNDFLWAGAGDTGDDVSAGGAGDDVVAGGAGNDFLIGGGLDDGNNMDVAAANEDSTDDGNDTIFGGSGDDTLLGGGWDDGAGNDDGNYDDGEAVVSGTSNDAIWAGAGNDLIIAAAGNDALGGGTGDDTINGGDGNDTIYGGVDGGDTGVNDVIDGGNGNDVIFSAAGNDSVVGGAGNDEIFSGGGTDTVDGGSGNDTLWGGGGNDDFTGGSGDDLFIFEAGHGDDTITDFDIGDDSINLAEVTAAFADTASVIAAASQVSGGISIDLGGGDSLTLEGLSLNDLDQVTFIL